MFSLVCFLIFVANLSAHAEGMRFFEGSWKEVLAQAKAQKKPIFIDIYTTWCGPCKQMSKNIFPMENVGEKFNSLFINYKIDAEKGEGIEIAKKYSVDAYPTYLFVDADENLFYKSIGSMPADKFIAEADLAITALKEEKPLSMWDKEYADGKREAAFLLAYLQKRSKMRMNSAEILEEYVKTQSEETFSSDDNLALIIENVGSIQGKAFDILMKNKARIDAMRGDRRFMMFNMKVQQLVKKEVAKAIKNKDKELIDKCIVVNNQTYDGPMIKFAEKANAETYMAYYKGIKDKDSYIKAATDYTEKFVMIKSIESIKKIDDGNYERFMQMYKTGMRDSTKEERFQEIKKVMANMESRSTATALNNAAWGAVELFDDKATLEKVAPWLERALEIYREPFILDSYAHLLFKLGKKQEAIKIQKEASEKAMTNGETSEEIAKYDAFLQEMQK